MVRAQEFTLGIDSGVLQHNSSPVVLKTFKGERKKRDLRCFEGTTAIMFLCLIGLTPFDIEKSTQFYLPRLVFTVLFRFCKASSFFFSRQGSPPDLNFLLKKQITYF